MPRIARIAPGGIIYYVLYRTNARPFEADAWVNRTAWRLQLQHSLRPRGRRVGWRKNPKSSGEPE